MPKLVIIGAGSGFGGKLSIDTLSCEALKATEIALCDIHPGRLEKVRSFVERTIEKHNLPAKVVASTDRREVLPGADFVVTSISVAGWAYRGFPFSAEIEIPRKYGVDQAVADTIGPGGVFRFLRTAPVHRQIFQDIEELCPDALVLNHTNPMCMLTWMHHAATPVRNVGLCHGVQGTAMQLANWIGVPHDEVSFLCSGINHLAWFLEFRRGKEDLLPRIRALLDDPDKLGNERVRLEILKHFGTFSTESTRHDSEYLPYFRRTPEMIDHFALGPPRPATPKGPPKREWDADTGGESDEAPVGELKPSLEYTSRIMEAVVTNQPFRFNGNVMNTGLIPNLPEGCCVEVPCMADARGVQPCSVGPLPPHLAALCRSNVAVQELAVRAFLDRDREAAFHACCLDPLAASLLTLDQMRAMFDELWESEKDLLAYFDPAHTGPMPETCAP